MSIDQSDVVTYRVVTFALGLRLMSTAPRRYSGFVEGFGGAYGAGFACLRPGVIEQIIWGEPPPTRGTRLVFAARGLTWRLVKVTSFAVRYGMMPSGVRRHPFAQCR